MANRKKQNSSAERSAVLKELASVDKLFAELERSKKLPTFPEFFISCILLGEGNCVNLQKMFPALYSKVLKQIKSIKIVQPMRYPQQH